MNFIRGNFRKIQQSALPVLCELFNSRQYAYQPPDLANLSRKLSHHLPSDTILFNSAIPSSFIRVVSYYVEYSYRSTVLRLIDRLRGEPDLLVPKSSNNASKSDSDKGMVKCSTKPQQSLIPSQKCLNYIFMAAFAIGIYVILANFNSISEIFRFSFRLDNSLRGRNMYAFLNASHKDNC